MDLLWKVIRSSEIPISQFHLTHMTRNDYILEEGKKWLRAGGWLDFTADAAADVVTLGNKAAAALMNFRKEELSLQHITVSSDAFGSMPVFDSQGNLLKYEVASPGTLFSTFKTLYFNFQLSLAECLSFFTTNPAKLYHLAKKAEIKVGYDADLLVLDENMNIKGLLNINSTLTNYSC
jgi:beta-aspartyl-dipeptidase (metallo-type)